MPEFDITKKLKQFADEIGMNEEAIEHFVTLISPSIDTFVMLSLEVELGKEFLTALTMEAEARGYSDEDSVSFLFFSFEEKTGKPIEAVIEQYVIMLIDEMRKTQKLVTQVFSKVIKDTDPKLWEKELQSYADSMENILQQRANMLLGSE
jgi:hypothetical protein